MRLRSIWACCFVLYAGLIGCTLPELPYPIVNKDVTDLGVADAPDSDVPIDVDGGLDGGVFHGGGIQCDCTFKLGESAGDFAHEMADAEAERGAGLRG